MKEQSKKELEKKILTDIQKTGFVTELNVVSTLLKSKWQTEHSFTYEDKDENQSREIDVIGSRHVFEKKCNITVNLIIETKKSESPWIIFTTQKKAPVGWGSNIFITGRSWITKKRIGANIYDTPIINSRDVQNKSPRQNHMQIGKAFHELHKSPSDKSKIYSSLISCGKAAKYYRDINHHEGNSVYKPGDAVSIMLFLPLVVLDGQLFEVYNDAAGEIKIEQKSFIPIEIFYSSPKYKTTEKQFGIVFAPDVITYNYLQTYIEDIEVWQSNLLQIVNNKIEKGF